MLNHITIIGRITRDPEIKYTSSGIPFVRFSVAVDRPRKNPETGERETDFLDVVAWRQTAEFVNSYVNKGRLILVEGRLQVHSWDAQDGSKRKSAEIVADNVQGLDRAKTQGAESGDMDTAAPVRESVPSQSSKSSGPEDYDPFAEE